MTCKITVTLVDARSSSKAVDVDADSTMIFCDVAIIPVGINVEYYCWH